MNDKVEEIKAKLTEEQLELYEEFKRKADVPNGKHTELVLLRYLGVCKFEVEVALKVKSKFKFEEYFTKFSEEVDETELTNAIKSKKLKFGGKDSEGRRIVHFYFRHQDPKAQSIECSLMLHMVLMDIMLDDWDVITKGCTTVCWMDGTGWSNFDFTLQQRYMELFKEFLPFSTNMMGTCYLVNSPWYVRLAINLMKPLIPKEEAMEKYIVCSSEQLGDYFSCSSALIPTDEFELRYLSKQYSNWV
jgi:hypothetical protein